MPMTDSPTSRAPIPTLGRGPLRWMRCADGVIVVAGTALLSLLLAALGAKSASFATLILMALLVCLLGQSPSPMRSMWGSMLAAGLVVALYVLAYPTTSDATVDAFAEILIVGLGIAAGRTAQGLLRSWECRYQAAMADLRKAEVRASSAFAQMQDFHATVPDVQWETDARMRLRVLSSRCEEVFGVPANRLIGLDPFDVAEQFLGRYGGLRRCVALMRARSPGWSARLAWYDRRRRLRVATIRGIPKHCPAGNFVGFRGVIVDCSER